MIVAIVTGSREGTDRDAVWRALDEVMPDVVIHGACGRRVNGKLCGVDLHAGAWAKDRGADLVEVPALWAAYDKKAGPRRNAFMAKIAKAFAASLDARLVCIAMQGTRGTANMKSIAMSHGIEVIDHGVRAG